MAYISFQPNDHFNTKLYTGNGSTQNITGVGHQVDWTWIKYRTDTEGHGLFDVLRGALYRLQSNSTGASSSQAGTVTAFGSDGFSLGNNAEVNANNGSYVSWNWKANGSGSSNTDGSINTTYTSANTTSGFSISTYAGTGSAATVGHGLGAVPKMIIVKRLNGASDWMVYHESIGNDHRLRLNTTAAKQDNPVWNDTTPTSSVFSMNDNGDANASGGNYVAYCFAEKKGFSKFGSYTGNGNADGTFIYTGFKPAFIILKNTEDGAKNWEMLDNKRPSSGQNPADDILFPDTSDPESSSQTDRLVDFVSNGIKIRGNSAQMNASGQKFIFMAFAEEPLVSSNGVPATAR